MQSIWKRIETQLRIEAGFEKMPASEALSDFQPSATEEEIQAAETALGIEFPIDSYPENGTYHRWLAPNWQAFLSRFADDLEAGEYCYEEGRLTC